MSSLCPPSRSTRFRLLPAPLQLESIDESYDSVDDLSMDSSPYGSDSKSETGSCGQRRPSLHRTSSPLHSILKRSSQFAQRAVEEDEFPNGMSTSNSFEISVVRYRTSCCRALVCIEHISDWIHETPLEGQRCPSCMLPCTLHTLRSPKHVDTPTSSSLSPSSERILALARLLLEQGYIKLKAPLSLSAFSPPRPTSDVSYTSLFDAVDQTYPETEYSYALGSSKFITDARETSVRVLSTAALTLVLFALLS